MRDRLVLTAAILATTLLPQQAQAACKEKLAEVDQRLASPQIDANLRNSVQMFRDQAAGMCSQGNEATAMQTLGLIEMMLPPSKAQQEQATADRKADDQTKSRLTNEFLEGTWCSMTGEERVQLVFSADGTYQPCFPDSMTQGYGHCVSPESTTEWLDRYDRDESRDKNQIELATRRFPGSMVYKRGDCKLHGR